MKHPGMKVFSPDSSELMEITGIHRDGSSLVLQGKIMGSMPMKAVVHADQARRGLSLIDFGTFLFIISFFFRALSSRK